MSSRLTFLLPCTPIYGHVTPMIAIGRRLLARGHRVRILTGGKYAPMVAAAGLEFLPLPHEVDYDDACLDDWLPGRAQLTGISRARHDIVGLFVRPLVAQHRALAAALAAQPADAVLSEAAFLGSLPLVLGQSSAHRIPVAAVSATPLSLTSVDCAPFGSGLDPGHSAHTRRRNRLIQAVLRFGPLRPLQAELNTALAQVGAPAAPGSYFDVAAMFDLTFQLSVPGLEYPRREMPPTMKFVGPMQPPVPRSPDLPRWWGDLNGSRPVVHVTQGTMANVDLGQLLVPTIDGLASDDVLVVATTGGRPVSNVLRRLGGRLATNARVAEFLPYAELLPRVDAVVTNGGFGGVQQALAYGLPLVVAGVSEDKLEVAARVAWAGAGINLYTAVPSPERIRRAVRRVLQQPRYHTAARGLQHQIADHGDPVEAVIEGLETLVSARAVSARLA